MPKTIRQIKKQQESLLKFGLMPKKFIATFGDEDGDLDAGNEMVYVRDVASGTLFAAKNYNILPIPGRLVIVEHLDGELVVTRYWRIYGSDEEGPNVPPHSHEPDKGNTDFISAMRFLPLLVLPISGFTVRVYGGIIQKSTGVFLRVENVKSLDLSSHQPSAGARWVVLEADDTGAIVATDGDVLTVRALLNVGNIPVVSGTPLCAIRFYDGQGLLQRNPTGVDDFVDLRLFASRSSLTTLHNLLPDLEGGGEYLGEVDAYHLSFLQWYALVKGESADGYHTHTGLGNAKYRQMVWASDGAGGFEFVTGYDGLPLTALHPLE